MRKTLLRFSVTIFVLGAIVLAQAPDSGPYSVVKTLKVGGDGTRTVVKENSPTSFVLEQTLQTKTGARTFALDPNTGQLYLVTAEFGPPPPPTAEAEKGRGGPRGRGAQVPDSFTILVVRNK